MNEKGEQADARRSLAIGPDVASGPLFGRTRAMYTTKRLTAGGGENVHVMPASMRYMIRSTSV